MKSYYIGTVLSDGLTIRTGPGITYSTVSGILNKGDTIVITELLQNEFIKWGKHKDGWSIVKYNNDDTIELVEQSAARAPADTPLDDTTTDEEDNEEEDDTNDTEDDLSDSNNTSTDTSNTVNPVTLEDVLRERGTDEENSLSGACMNLFGLPYQLNQYTDIRVPSTNKSIGRTYLENIASQGPILTIMPCRPRYLGNVSDTEDIITFTSAFEEYVTGNGALAEAVGNGVKDFRYYDLRLAYRECMRYANLLCRFSASAMGIGNIEYPPGTGDTLISFDWKDYRFDGRKYSGIIGQTVSFIGDKFSKLGDKIKNYLSKDEYDAIESEAFKQMAIESEIEEDDTISSLFATANYMQFYCDAEMGTNDRFTNETQESKIKGLFEGASEWSKELQFIAKSLMGDADNELSGFAEFIGGGVDFLGTKLGEVLGGGLNGAMGGVVDKFLTIGKNVFAKGETIVIPDVYMGSERECDYTINIKLRAVYGNVVSQYFDIVAPTMHWLAIAAPQQTSSNTYGAPFLIKAIYDGVFTCNMGIVTGLDINRSSANNWTIFGMPNEVDINVTIKDLYSDLSITPPNHPLMFLRNVSLIEYLAVWCGLNVLKPNLAIKATLNWTTIVNSIDDISEYVIGNELDKLENFSLSSMTLLNGLGI